MDDQQEAKAIKELFQRMDAAWGKHEEMSVYRSCFTEDADYVTFQGQRLKGRQEIADVHEKLFKGILKDSRMTTAEQELKLLTPEVAIVHRVGAIRMRWQKKTPKSRLSINTNVVVKRDGEWKVAAFQNGRITGPGIMEKLFGN
ncbi:SgcJ/EcaC family oxidoreductase [Paenibacillus arenilitoris]|nr:SgcJ/EcaC family oxidoreductase [Paenibacillus arenilitoris]